MTEKGLSLPEFTALVVLAVEAGEVSNTELRERRGLTIDGAKRRRLNELKLVDSWKEGRSFVHTLTDSGWARLAEDLHTGTLPAFTGSSGVMARALFTWLPAFLSRTDQRLSDVFQPVDLQPPSAPEPSGGQPSNPQPSALQASGSHPFAATVETDRSSGEARQDLSHEQVEAHVRTAYAKLADTSGTWVRLARLRELLAFVPKGLVDEVLVRMERTESVSLIPESNQKGLTREDQEAAVVIGNQAKHLLWISTI